ncbi:hypothetical protein JTB14_001606 [Gonioctena quinquepunctata]|nr:hypothetical protein JTB14_001606 [Gonioctena quinquepunctata]
MFGTHQNENAFPQIIAITVASISGITSGILQAWPSPFTLKIFRDKENYDITEYEASYFSVISPVVMVVTCPIFAILSDHIGRKRTLMFTSIFSIMTWLLLIVSENLWLIYLSRFVSGIADGCLFATLPVYVGEVSLPRIRGTWGNIVSVFMMFGMLLINAIGCYFSVKETAYICLVVPITFFVLLNFIPESPYYFILKGDEEGAKQALRWLRAKQEVDGIFIKLKSDLETQMSERGTWKELVSIESNRKALIAGLFLRCSQQFSGISPVIANTKLIFELADTSLSSDIPTIIFSGVATVGMVMSSFVIERIGKRKSYIMSLSGCGITMFLVAIYLFLDQHAPRIDLTPVKWIPLVGILSYDAISCLGLINLPTLMAGELFSTSVKAKGMSVCVLALGISSISAITSGILQAWPSPFNLKISRDKENYDITEYEASYFSVISPIVMVLTCPIFTILSDHIGRKRTLMFTSIFSILAWLVLIVSENLWLIYLSRFFSGVADGCFFATLPAYIGEVSIPRIRGTWGNILSVFLVFGTLLINSIGSYFSVKETAYICLIVPITLFVLLNCIPESPYYFILKGDEEKAKQALRWLRATQEVDEVFTKLKSDLEIQMSERGTWRELVSIESNRKALIAGLFLRFSQQFSGVSSVVANTKLIFELADTSLSPEIPTIIFCGLGLVGMVISSCVAEKVGKRKSYIISLAGCGITMCLVGIYLYLDKHFPNIDLTPVKWIPIAGILLFDVISCLGLINLPTLMAGELFSTSVKAKGMSVCVLAFGICMSLTNYIFSVTNSYIGLYAPLFIFGLVSIFSTFLTCWLLPETKGKTLEEIQQGLGVRG